MQREWSQVFGGTRWLVLPSGQVVDEGQGLLLDGRLPGIVAKEYEPYIISAATKCGVPVPLIVAMVCVQSGGKRTKRSRYRYEPAHYRRYVKPAGQGWIGHKYYSSPRVISAAYGPMRVMYADAYEMGFGGEAKELLEDGPGIKWGTMRMAAQKKLTKFNPVLVVAVYESGGLYASKEDKRHLRCRQGHIDSFMKYNNAAVALAREMEG